MDLRERVVATYERGDRTIPEVAREFKVGEATLNRWLRLRRETGFLAPRPHRGGTPAKITEDHLGAFKVLVDQAPDKTHVELSEAVLERMGITVSSRSVGRTLERMEYSFKKNISCNGARHRAR